MTRCLIGVLVAVTELGGLFAALADANEQFKVNHVISASEIIRADFRFIKLLIINYPFNVYHNISC
jgi:hypothetical protein